jgi:hypothetical protein
MRMPALLHIAFSMMMLMALSPPVQAQGAEAGKVLLALGDVKVVRDGKTQVLAKGAGVQAGDAITTGVASNAQLRMSDGAVIAIRAQSEFKINEYKFNGKEDGSEKANLSLVKGGIRAVTGTIGKTNQDNLKVNAVVATVGIRGTGFNISYCNGDCINKDKSAAKDGLYAGVFEGKISVTNQAGTEALGVNQFLYVADQDSRPIRLSTPPNFLPDPLAGQKSVKPKSSGSQAGDIPTLNVAVTTPASSSDAQVSAAPSSIPSVGGISVNQQPALASTTSPYAPSTQYNQSALGNGLPAPQATNLYLQRAETNPSGVIGADNLPPHSIEPVDATLMRITTSGSGVNTTVTRINDIPTTPPTPTALVYDIGTAQQKEGGNWNGVVSWGRWANGTIAELGRYENANGGKPIYMPAANGFHYIVGTPTSSGDISSLRLSNTSVSFTLLGATTPTAVSNPQGTWAVTSGSLTANFAANSISGNMGLYTNQAAGYGFYNMAITPVNTLSNLTAANNAVNTNVSLVSGSLTTCAAGCAGKGNVTFYGNNVQPVQAAGLSYNFNTGSNVVQGVAVFKK